MERGWKPNVEVSPPCPRCGSSNTKFCYYNNYSLTQPRYFCKACRRYWTKGGSLRKVPIGGGCRKTRRVKSLRDPTPVSAPPTQPSTSTANNIDLAAVYANFLNPHNMNIETPNNSQLHEPAGIISIPPIQLISTNFHMSSNLPPALFESPAPLFGEGLMFPNEFPTGNSLTPMENDSLPPLPGEEGIPGWPVNQILPSDDQPFEQSSQVVNIGNMSMFSGLNLEAIFRP